MPNAPRRYRPSRPAYTSTRPTSSQRGYLDGWPELRDYYKAAHPYCEDCPYPRASYVEVDHIIPFDGMDDPLRLDEDNLRTRCRRHHAAKTARWDTTIRQHYKQHGKEATLAKYREAMRK
jgi:5-methylcytosine-specific restriction endonuclease McrA